MTPPTIRTYTGKIFNILEPTPDMVCLEDIAHSLGMLCRFTGHVRRFYSVAEHSVLISYMVPKKDALWGLLHDGTEAYVGDMSYPLKHQIELLSYLDIERHVQTAIGRKFDLAWGMPSSVHLADRELCKREGMQLVQGWTQKPDADTWAPLRCLGPRAAEISFLRRYGEITLCLR